MTRSVLMAVVTIALSATATTTKAHQQGSAGELRTFCLYGNHNPGSLQEVACLQRIQGIQGGIFALKFVDENFEFPFCLPKEGWSNDQAERVFVEYVKAHPSEIDRPAELVFIRALAASYPPQHGCGF